MAPAGRPTLSFGGRRNLQADCKSTAMFVSILELLLETTTGIQKSLTASQLCHIIIGKIVGTIMFLAYK